MQYIHDSIVCETKIMGVFKKRVKFPLTCPADTVYVCGGGGLGDHEYLAYHLSLILSSCALTSDSCNAMIYDNFYILPQ